MRITGGTYGGRPLKTPKNDAIRPTLDKVRQAMFNMLESRGLVDGAVVLDAFCGTGALGLEAISRGASFAVFIDNNQKHLLLCRENIETLDVLGQCAGIVADSTKSLQKPDDLQPATLVFLDPPYQKGLAPLAIDALAEGGWLAQGAVFVIEADSKENVDTKNLNVLQEKIYGDTKVILALKDTAVNQDQQSAAEENAVNDEG